MDDLVLGQLTLHGVGVPLEALLDAVSWSEHFEVLADELWVAPSCSPTASPASRPPSGTPSPPARRSTTPDRERLRGLSVRDHMVLQLWGRRWRYGAARDGEARCLLGLSGTEVALRVARLAEGPAAIAAYPEVTRRVREVRGTRRRPLNVSTRSGSVEAAKGSAREAPSSSQLGGASRCARGSGAGGGLPADRVDRGALGVQEQVRVHAGGGLQ
ncbi:DUF3263 domain-containing protein [Micrococcus luteus]|uniref:DUF3263 domain-containing protein n=1 Tax=Micrococcus luteus TaxID=1270 RepID=UPI001CB88D8E|nr:DUF3263 domain-containing protein [Micrococcus luteus]